MRSLDGFLRMTNQKQSRSPGAVKATSTFLLIDATLSLLILLPFLFLADIPRHSTPNHAVNGGPRRRTPKNRSTKRPLDDVIDLTSEVPLPIC